MEEKGKKVTLVAVFSKFITVVYTHLSLMAMNDRFWNVYITVEINS